MPPLDYTDSIAVTGEVSSSILGSPVGFTMATVADFATSIWNSLPFTPEVATEDLLTRVSSSALKVYEEHPDAVHTASLIGGSLAPGGLALKLLGRARQGATALGYTSAELGGSIVGQVKGAITGGRQVALKAELEAAVAQAGTGTTEYKRISKQIFIANGIKEIADNAVIELAVLGAMNAHPYMEDYVKNPVENFSLSMLVGGVLGVGFSIPMSTRAIFEAGAPVIKRNIESILQTEGLHTAIYTDMTNTSQYQRATANMEIYKNLADSTKPENQIADPLRMEMAKLLVLKENAAREAALIRMFPTYKDADANVKQLVQKIASDPNTVGVDKIRFVDMLKMDKITAQVTAIAPDYTNIMSNPIIKNIVDTIGTKPAQKQQLVAALKAGGFDDTTIAKITGDILPRAMVSEQGQAAAAFVRFDADGNIQVFNSKGARNAATAADVVDAKEAVNYAIKNRNYATLRKDAHEENLLRTTSSAEANLEYVKELGAIDKLNEYELANVLIDPEHTARLNAMLAAVSKMTPEQLEKVKINVTSNYPQLKAQTQFLERTVGKDYPQKIISLAENRAYTFDAAGLSPGATKMIDNWVHGAHYGGDIQRGIAELRRAFEYYFRKTMPPAGEAGNIRYAKEIWEAGAKFRAEARKHADADGYIYLARGLSQAPVGSSAVESYSAKFGISQKFGSNVNFYKIHVDNVIGSLGSGRLKEAEILVAPRHHDIVNNIPIETMDTTKITLPTEEIKHAVTPKEIHEMLTSETQRQAKELLRGGASAEEVMSRLNMSKEGVAYIQSGGDLLKYVEDGKEWRIYKEADKIGEYLNPQHKMAVMAGNKLKNPVGESMNKLDNNAGAIMHRQQIEDLTYNSGSTIANSILSTYAHPEMKAIINDLQIGLAEVNNIHVGDPRWQSADQALRKTILGPQVTWLGKQLILKTDDLKKRYLEPLSAALLPLKDKPVGLLELNDVMNTLAGLKGWREVRKLDDGTMTIMQREMVEATDPATGKVKKQMMEKPFKDPRTEKDYVIKQDEVYNFLNSTRELTRELYKMHNLNRVATGQKPLSDLGFWLPPLNLVNKNHAFVIDPTGKQNVKLLVATKEDELASLVASFEKANPGKFQIVPKSQQEDFNLLKGYTDYEAWTEYANVAMQHKGASSLAQVPLDDRMINNIMQGYENLILQGSRKYAETYLSDTMQWLDKMSDFNRRFYEGQPKQGKGEEYVRDSAITVKNILLGRDQLEQSPTLKKINTLTDTLLAYATNAVNRTFSTLDMDKVGTVNYYNTLNKELKKAGIDKPILGSFQEFLAAATPQSKDTSHAVISAGNGLTATLMLRVFEIAQPLVNVLSLPILMSSAIMENLPKVKIGVGTTVETSPSMTFPIVAMYDGMKSFFNPQRQAIARKWKDMGIIEAPTRQFTDVLGVINQAPFSKLATEKALDAINGIQEKAIIKDFLAKPADWAESFTREISLHVGFNEAKRTYKGISDMGATIMATNFMDRAIGNYTAAQRPTLFQGSFGAGLGLFQTYFLTYLQNIYRGLENRNFKQLASLTMAQTGLFGTASWPGFNMLSEQIVSNFSDDHYDLTTGTYRAVGNNTAEMILYGLPSSLGPALYTRGDVSPRIPSSVTQFAMVNGIKEGWSAAHTIISKVAQGMPHGQGTQSLFEALSLQTLNRPIARWSELVTGSSITTQENTVSPTSEVWSPIGIASRVIGVRPLQEQVARNAIHLNAYYESQDHDRRENAYGKIKTAMRANNPNMDAIIDGAALDYIRAGGTYKGWQSMVNKILIDSPDGASSSLLQKLEPTSPLNRMLRDTY